MYTSLRPRHSRERHWKRPRRARTDRPPCAPGRMDWRKDEHDERGGTHRRRRRNLGWETHWRVFTFFCVQSLPCHLPRNCSELPNLILQIKRSIDMSWSTTGVSWTPDEIVTSELTFFCRKIPWGTIHTFYRFRSTFAFVIGSTISSSKIISSTQNRVYSIYIYNM